MERGLGALTRPAPMCQASRFVGATLDLTTLALNEGLLKKPGVHPRSSI